MFKPQPFRNALGHRVVIAVSGDTWRGRLTGYRDEWVTLTDAEYIDTHGAQHADGAIMLPERRIDYMQVTDGEEGGS